ncbi:MAG: TetR/AcrR family transcriptional regulator [Proteobacteria bacterium]|nr:TetR/AcrR family transcriptional regulator [Pseudomonadota bacterium]
MATAKKDAIIEAAAAVFGRRGYKNATIAQIAEGAGVGKGTVYEYFDSKAELFLAVFDWVHQQVAEAAVVAAEKLGGSVADRMRARVEAAIRAVREKWDFYGLFMEFWTVAADESFRPTLHGIFKRMYREYRGQVVALIREGVDRGEFRADVDPEALAAASIGAIDGILLQAWFDDSLDPLAVARTYLDVLLTGLSRAKGGDR